MVAEEELGSLAVRIAMDNTSFQQGMQDMKRQLSVIGSEFKSGMASLGNYGNSLDGLKLKTTALGEKIDVQKRIVGEYQAQLERSKNTLESNSKAMLDLKARVEAAKTAWDSSKKALGENANETVKLEKTYKDLSKEYQNQESLVRNNAKTIDGYTIQLNNAKTALSGMENELKDSKAALASMENELKDADNSLTKHKMTVSDLSKELKKMGVSWQSVGQTFQNVGRTLSVAITAPLVAGAAAGIKFDAAMEDATTNFTTMLGSAEKAKDMVADLTEFAKDTPFEMIGLNEAAVTMLNFGVKSQDVMKDLQMLGDVAMGNQEKLSRISLAFGQIISTGRLMGQDLLQLVNAGFNPLQEISQKTGRSMKDLKDDMEKGKISAQMVTDAFKSATSEGGRFFNAMENGSKTLNGQMSTLKDSISIALGEALKPAFEYLSKDLMPKLIQGVESATKWFGNLSQSQKETALKIGLAAAAIGPLMVGLGALIKAIGSVSTAVKGLQLAFTFLMANPIVLAIAAIAAVIGMMAYQAGSASREVKGLTEALRENYQKEAEARKAAIDKNNQADIDRLNKSVTDELDYSVKRQAVIQEEYDKEMKGAQKKEQALKKNLQDRMSVLEKAHNEEIQRIRAEYGVVEDTEKSKTDIVKEEAQKRKDALDKEQKAAEDAYNNAIEAIRKEYGVFEKVEKSKTEIAQEEGKKRLEAIDQQEKAAEDTYNESIRKIREEYGVVKSTEKSKVELAQDTAKTKIALLNDELDAAKDSYKEQLKIAKETYNNMTREAEKVYQEKMKLLYEEDLDEKIKVYQDQIDELDNKTKEEDKILKQQQADKKLLDLQSKIDNAKTIEGKLNAEKEYNEEVTERARERELELRENQIDSLKKQIDEVRKNADNGNQILSTANAAKKIALDQELAEAKQRATDQLTAVQISEDDKLTKVRQRIADQKKDVDIELILNLHNIEDERAAKENAEADKLKKTKENLADQRTQIDTDTDTNIKKIQAERLEKEKAESVKLTATKNHLADERTKIDTETAANIAKIQEERIAKEKAEDAKFTAAKTALDNESKYFDTWVENVYKPALQKKLDAALDDEKIRHDKIMDNLQKEIDKINEAATADKAKVDAETKAKVDTSALDALYKERQKLYNEQNSSNSIFDNTIIALQIKSIDKKIEVEKKRLHNEGVPGFASGVENYKGGWAWTGEHGPELMYVPKGASIYSHEKSMAMAGNTININAYYYGIKDNATAEYANKDLVRKVQNRGLAVGFR